MPEIIGPYLSALDFCNSPVSTGFLSSPIACDSMRTNGASKNRDSSCFFSPSKLLSIQIRYFGT